MNNSIPTVEDHLRALDANIDQSIIDLGNAIQEITNVEAYLAASQAYTIMNSTFINGDSLSAYVKGFMGILDADFSSMTNIQKQILISVIQSINEKILSELTE